LLEKLRMRFRSVFFRSQVDDDLDDEIRFHLEQQIQEYLDRGVARADARVMALGKLGVPERIKEDCRDMRRVDYIENLVQDLGYGIRLIVKKPGFAAVAMVTLALGVGANTAIFSLVNGILLRPLPYNQPDRLARLTEYYPKGAYVTLRDQSQTMDVAACAAGEELNLARTGAPPIRLIGTIVSANFFSMLGARAELGRLFRAGEDTPGNNNVVVLSHSMWQNQFGGAPDIIGHRITVEGVSREVVGVMPADFSFASNQASLWVPLSLDPRKASDFWGNEMPLFGRLRTGATLDQARHELTSLMPGVIASFPYRMPAGWNKDVTVIPLQQDLVGDMRARLLILLGAVSLVLLIACANVASLVLARSAGRRKELAIRGVLGAGRSRILRQLLTESVLLGLGGGALGLLLARFALVTLKTFLPRETPRLGDVGIDGHVLVFTAGLAIATGLLFGLAPALSSWRLDLATSLNTGSRRSSGTGTAWLYNGLVVAEIGLAVVLVIGAGLLVKSLWLLGRTSPGFRPEQVLTIQITPNASSSKDRAACISFYDELIRRVRLIPGVEEAGAVNALPLGGDIPVLPAAVEGHPGESEAPAPLLWSGAITPLYTDIMGIPILEGRGFSDGDRADSAPVVLVTASTARAFWPGQEAVGKHVKAVWEREWRTVIGVISDVRQYGLDQARPSWVDGEIYMPYAQAVTGHRDFPSSMSLVLRSTADRSRLAAEVRGLVADLNADVPVSDVRAMNEVVSASMSAPNSIAWLFATFAAMALVLGAVGIYGLISYRVAERTHEMGVRMALGAKRGDVLRLIVGQGLVLALIGVGAGGAAALALTRLLGGLLYGVKPVDPATFAIVPVLLLAVALVAAYIPARRATRVDPVESIRFE
jgi:putative ABC transport system permease protein